MRPLAFRSSDDGEIQASFCAVFAAEFKADSNLPPPPPLVAAATHAASGKQGHHGRQIQAFHLLKVVRLFCPRAFKFGIYHCWTIFIFPRELISKLIFPRAFLEQCPTPTPTPRRGGREASLRQQARGTQRPSGCNSHPGVSLSGAFSRLV